MAKKNKNNNGPFSWFFMAIHGRLLSSDVFVHNWGKILCVMIMLLVFITNRYNCQTRMETIQALNRQLEVVKTERIRERSRYMSRTRETGMQELVDSMRLNLHIQDRPPFQIKY